MPRFFTLVTALLFFAGAAVHAYRLFLHPFNIIVANHNIPVAASWVGIGVGLLFGVMLLLEARR